MECSAARPPAYAVVQELPQSTFICSILVNALEEGTMRWKGITSMGIQLAGLQVCGWEGENMW